MSPDSNIASMLDLILLDPSRSLLDLNQLDQSQMMALYAFTLDTRDPDKIEQFGNWLTHVCLDHPDTGITYVETKREIRNDGIQKILTDFEQEDIFPEVFKRVFGHGERANNEEFALDYLIEKQTIAPEKIKARIELSQRMCDGRLEKLLLSDDKTIKWLAPLCGESTVTKKLALALYSGQFELADYLLPMSKPHLNSSLPLRNLSRNKSSPKKIIKKWVEILLPLSSPSDCESDSFYQLILNKSFSAAQLLMPFNTSARALIPAAIHDRQDLVKNILAQKLGDQKTYVHRAVTESLSDKNIPMLSLLIPSEMGLVDHAETLRLSIEMKDPKFTNQICEIMGVDRLKKIVEKPHLLAKSNFEYVQATLHRMQSYIEKTELIEATPMPVSRPRSLRL
jgi:hypothetical protein